MIILPHLILLLSDEPQSTELCVQRKREVLPFPMIDHVIKHFGRQTRRHCHPTGHWKGVRGGDSLTLNDLQRRAGRNP